VVYLAIHPVVYPPSLLPVWYTRPSLLPVWYTRSCNTWWYTRPCNTWWYTRLYTHHGIPWAIYPPWYTLSSQVHPVHPPSRTPLGTLQHHGRRAGQRCPGLRTGI